jgi:hypothetical protein
MKSYVKVNDLTKEEIENACKKSKCFRQANAVCKVHLLNIKVFAERVAKENIDISHFNNGDVKCSKCGNDYQVATILDFDDVGRQLGTCKNCDHSEWVKDGGDIIDSFHYFTEGYKSKEMLVVGHTII